jgi:hypothetical protein
LAVPGRSSNVTIDHLDAPAEGAPLMRARGWRTPAADATVMATLLWWGTGLTWGTGGRDAHVLSVGLVLVAIAAALIRPWDRLPRVVSVATLAPALAAFVVCLVAPTGWAGADVAASWVYTGLLAAVVAAWAQDERRRTLLLAAIMLAPLGTFAKGWLAWWGQMDPSRPFIGTFYWHNQEAAFLLVGALTGLALVLTTSSVTRVGAWLAVALCGAGVVLSTSRGAMLALMAAFLLVALAGLTARAWRVVLTTALAAASGFATATVLAGPPFFPHRAGALAGTAARAQSGETLGANSGHRLDDWAQAVHVALHWPLAGAGFHGFGSASALIDPAGKGSLTPFAHNGFLQLFVDGGVLLGLSALAALVAAVLVIGRRLPAALRVRDWRPVVLAAAVCGALLHSAIDFDWSYPALLSGFGLLLVTAAPALRPSGPKSVRFSRILPAAWAVLVVLAVIGAWHGGLHLNEHVTGQL